MAVGVEHETWVELFREQPELVLELLRRSGKLELPEYQELRIEETNLTQIVPVEYDTDLVLTLRKAKRPPELAMIIEVQRGKDPDKPRTWPHYSTSLHARRKWLSCVVVVATTTSVAAWASQSVNVGPGLEYAPTVIGPDDVPRELTQEEAEALPELAVLSALVHGNAADGEGIPGVLRAFSVMNRFDAQRARRYDDLIIAALDDDNEELLESLMEPNTYEYKSKFYRNAEAKGRTEGEAKSVLLILEARGFTLTTAHREFVMACQDLPTLERWIRLAALAEPDDDVSVLLGVDV